MDQDLQALSEREKDTLRLLLGGHDAKSIARQLDLSVHTVNERLRDARRKLGVSSSRAAARRLGDAEQSDPNFLADKDLRVAGNGAGMTPSGPPAGQQRTAASLAWLGGGMLIMSLIIAIAALTSAFHANGDGQAQAAPGNPVRAVAAAPSDAVVTKAALDWLALVDGAHWDASWDKAGSLFKSQLPKGQWATTIQSVRQPLGLASSRVLQAVTKTTALPNAPAGDYSVIQFQTRFAHKADAIETVYLVRESSGWKVIGYFIR